MARPLRFVVFVALLLGASTALADEMKIGFVDMQRALNETEDGRKAKAQLKKVFDQKQKELDEQQEQLKKDIDDLFHWHRKTQLNDYVQILQTGQRQLAGNPLYQWFCLVDALDQVRVPSKSELQRFAHWLPAEQMRQVIDGLLKAALEKPAQLKLKEALDLEEYFLDSTCLKANIHFPTDWVLLRDGVRTLMKATLLIRKAGLRGRMQAPEEFLRRMNRLSIEMSQQARRAGDCHGGAALVVERLRADQSTDLAHGGAELHPRADIVRTGRHLVRARSAHSITSSARSSSEGEMASPSALAVLRLITSSNFVGCSTGRSAGK